MVAEFEYIFMKALHEKIKAKIIGGVFLKVTREDELYVNIRRKDGFDFTMYISELTERIHNGYSTDDAMYAIVKEYKNQILKKYLR